LPHKPAAFFSYVHFDDETDGGRLTEFRKRLSAEVRVQTGEEFQIFQDKDLKWGENWKKRIDESLDSTTFFIPVITPSFFNSQPCLDELERFLEREKKLGSEELVLPVYYVDTPLINEKPEGTTRKEKLAQVIALRQYFDWRELRFEALTSALISKTIAQLARQIRDAIQRTQAPSKSEELAGKKRGESIAAANNNPPTSGSGTTSVVSAREQISSSAETLAKVVSKTEPPTRVVDLMHRGDYTTITAAVQAANPGDRILVRAGLYNEGIVIDKPLEIIGDASPGEVVIRATGKDVVLFKTSMGRIANVTLRQTGGGEWHGIDIAQGRLEVEDCDISSDSLACVAVHGGADPRLRRNRIHNGKQAGIFVYENGQGTFEDNDIFSNALAGVEVQTGGNSTLRRNRIRDGKSAGVNVNENGQGTFEENDIFGNALAGVEIKSGGNPTLHRNRIHDGTAGVNVHENGQGTFEDNDIFSNAFAGVQVGAGGNPTLRRNRIHDGKQAGVLVYENGQGTFEDNDIFSNARVGVEARTGGNPTLRHNRINKNGSAAIRIYEKGGGTYEKNDLRENARGAWNISEDSAKNVKRTGNIENNQ